MSLILAGTGYRHCACRDCFEIAIGAEGTMCHHCEDAGCDPDRECQAPGAYGVEDEDPISADGEPHVTLERMLERLGQLDPAARERIEPALAAIPTAALTDPAHPYWDSTESVDIIAAMLLATNRASDRQ